MTLSLPPTSPAPFLRVLLLAALLCSGAFASSAAAEGVAGPILPVSDPATADDPRETAIALDSRRGRYLVAWTDTDRRAAGLGRAVNVRVVGSDAAPRGPVRVVSPAASNAGRTSVAYNARSDEFLVAWESDGFEGIVTQRLSSDGKTIGVRRRPTSETIAFNPGVAANSRTGGFLVAWELGGVPRLMYSRRVAPTGLPIGVTTQVSETDTSTGTGIAYSARLGDYLVAWVGDSGDGHGREVHVQSVAADGSAVGPDRRISEMGLVNDVGGIALGVSLIPRGASGEYIAGWRGSDRSVPELTTASDAFIQRLDADGGEVGEDDVEVSDRDGAPELSWAEVHDIAHNTRADEILAVWRGIPTDEKRQIRARTLAGTGTPSGKSFNVSADHSVQGSSFGVGYAQKTNEFLVAWEGTPPGDGKAVWVRRIEGGDPPAPGAPPPADGTVMTPPPGTPPGGGIPGTTGAPAAPNCAPEIVINASGGGGTIALTTTQLRINQNIGSAAVRRANGIEDWLNDGIVGSDICGGALAPDQFHPGVAYTTGVLNPLASVAVPRPVAIPQARDKGDVRFTLTTAQLRTNQRIYAAAVRRANALKERIEGRLTGGDLVDGTLSPDRARQDIYLGALTPATPAPAASASAVDPASGAAATFTLTAEQLAINQRIAQAAVQRTNDLRRLLSAGLTGDNFADGAITAQDWAPVP